MKGALIWQAPHKDLPFTSDHYEKFWSACEDLDAPVSLHILTGHSYNKDKTRKGVERYRGSVNLKLMDIANALFELVFCGVLERHPKLKIVSVENEVGWMPWIFQQWDYYYNRFKKENPPAVLAQSEQLRQRADLFLLLQRSRLRRESRLLGPGHRDVVQ